MAWLEVDSNQKSLRNLDQIQSISCTKAGSKLPNGHPLQKEHAAVAAYLSHNQLDVDGLITIFIGTQDQCDQVYQSIMNAIRGGKSFISIQDYQ